MSILAIKHLSLSFDGVKAIDDLSFTVEKGSITAIIGPNGSGKTSLMNIVTGWYVPSSGSIQIGSRRCSLIRRESCRELGISRTFQESRLFPQMTVMDNLLLAVTTREPIVALRSQGTADEKEEVKHALKQVGLWEKREALASTLSYGQRKLMEMARVILLKSDMILLDEPFAGLFSEMVEHMASLIEDLKQQGKTLLLIEHNMALIRRLSDKVIVLDSGTLLAQGTAEEVFKNPQVIEAYLGN